MEWYVITLIASSGILILQVIFSFIFGDIDIDIDGDLDFSDVISLKGILHFTIGSSLTLTTFGKITFLSVGCNFK